MKNAGYGYGYTVNKETIPDKPLKDIDNLGIDIVSWCDDYGGYRIRGIGGVQTAREIWLREWFTSKLESDLGITCTSFDPTLAKDSIFMLETTEKPVRYVLFCPIKEIAKQAYKYENYVPGRDSWRDLGKPVAYSWKIKDRIYVLDLKEKKVLYFLDKGTVGEEFRPKRTNNKDQLFLIPLESLYLKVLVVLRQLR
ncbi:hypothetical protein MUP35_04845 [Patescibacteria group bacterium]|nr:hypothetical protein [Patescibacteria group bacterium]